MSRGSFFAFIDTSASYLDERWEIGGKGEEYEVSQLTGKRAIRVCSKRFCCAYLPRHIYKVSHLCSGYRWLNSCINFSFENLPGIPIVFKSVIVTLYQSLGLRRSEGHGDYILGRRGENGITCCIPSFSSMRGKKDKMLRSSCQNP